MNEYFYTEKCDEVSGFGGKYEKACRDMIIAGMRWFDENPNAKPEFTGYEHVFGLISSGNQDAVDLSIAINNAAGSDCTGVMHEAAISHILYAHKHGWKKYIALMEERNELQ